MTVAQTITLSEVFPLESQPLDDAALFDMIDYIAALWRECNETDEKPHSPTYKASNARSAALCGEACALERQVAMTEVSTPRALAAKIRSIRDSAFDEESMLVILDQLVLDAERVAALG